MVPTANRDASRRATIAPFVIVGVVVAAVLLIGWGLTTAIERSRQASIRAERQRELDRVRQARESDWYELAYVEDPQLSDELLAEIDGAPELKYLYLRRVSCSEKGINHLNRLP